MRLSKTLLAITTALAFPTMVWAASERAPERASPELSARVDGVVGAESEALKIDQLDVTVRRHGGIVTTEMTVRFANPSNQTLEGQFGLTMPKGSVVTGYALDVGGEMIEGVLQPADRARVAFEKRVVRQIDPGLAEVDFSDRFETRVYPIFPQQGRTIRIRFVSPVDDGGKFQLPLDAAKIENFSLRVSGAEPDMSAGVRWTRDGANWISSGTGALDGAIGFTVPETAGLTISEHPGEGKFFELTGTIASQSAKDISGPLTILWDRSVSRLDDDLKREAALAAEMAKRMGASNVTVHLFDSGGGETITVAAAKLEETLRGVRYAGGTSYAGLNAAMAGKQGTCLLFSDGRATLGNREGFDRASCRMLAVSSGKEMDRAWLDGQARMHRGSLIDLGAVDDRAALDVMMKPGGIPAVTDTSGKAIQVRALPSGDGRYRVVGQLPGDGVVVADGKRITAASPVTPNFTGPGALWAAQHLALSRDSMPVEKLAEEARRWSVAAPGISFIVLETPADYADSGFVPPDSYPKALRAQFDQIRAQMAVADKAADKANYDRLSGLWAERKRWWQTGNPGRGERMAVADAVAESAAAVPLPPPPISAPPPPPPPVATQNLAESEDNSEIMVTAHRRDTSSFDAPVAVSAVSAEQVSETDNAADDGTGQITIVTEEWSTDRPYIAEWVSAGDDWQAAVARTEKEHGALPLFYLDLGEWHFRAGRVDEARRAVAAALELPSRDNQTLEIVAQRLLRYGDFDGAIWLLEQLIDREAERPHPVMALAQAYAKRGRDTRQRADIVKAHQLMVDVAMKRWPDEFQNVGEIALAEANALITELGGPDASGVTLDPKFIAALPLDIRVVAAWNTTRTDLDLWVVEPSREEVGYSHRYSAAGARYTQDVTGGYGPEEYGIRKGNTGTYRIEFNTFAVDRRNPNGPSVVTVRLIRDFGTMRQREETIDVEMQPDAEGRRLVGKIEF